MRSQRVAVLDISPTRIMYAGTDKAFATAYYHWFFLIQPFDLPERLIGADPAYYLRKKLAGWAAGLAHFDPRALAEYERCFRDPATIHATCEDYRAAATIDLEHDAADADARIDLPAARAVGNEGRGQPAVRPDGRLEERCARRARQARCRRGISSPRRRRRRRWPNCWRFSGNEGAYRSGAGMVPANRVRLL